MDTKVLEKIGLTKGEIKVYLRLLDLGSVRTGELTNKAKVSRSKIYEILEKLIEKGLASYVVKENTKYFEASDPRNLKEYVEKRKKELEDQNKELDAAMPELLNKQKLKKEKQTATVFEGYKGIRTVFNDVLNSLKRGDEYYAYASGKENYTKEFSIFIMNYHKKREEKGIKVKLLSHKELRGRVLKELGGYKHMQIRSSDEISSTSTLIFGSKVFIFTWKNPTVILMNSKEIAVQYKKHFLDIWNRAIN